MIEGMTNDLINLKSRNDEGTPPCEINLRSRKAVFALVQCSSQPSTAILEPKP